MQANHRLILSLLLIASTWPAAAQAGERSTCIKHYRAHQYQKAIDCYTQIMEEGTRDLEIPRLRGSAHAVLGHRKKAYADYKTYVERCPKCKYAYGVKKIVKDYEIIAGTWEPPPEGDKSSKPSPREPADLRAKRMQTIKIVKEADFEDSDPKGTSNIRTRRTARAKALVDKAEALQTTQPAKAKVLLEEAMGLVPKDHPIWIQAAEMKNNLEK